MKYKYQLHTHTSPTSRCGAMRPSEVARALYEAGYSGAVLTNHFYRGNSGIDRSLAWEEFVRAYENDYLECALAAREYDVDILFSIEEGADGGREIFPLGVTPKMLYEHPELAGCELEVWHKLMRECGGLIIQAHPFRERSYIREPSPLPLSLIDGIEVYNFCNSKEANDAAMEFIRDNPGLIATSGGDAHSVEVLSHAGIVTNERLRTIEDLIRVLKSGEYELICE